LAKTKTIESLFVYLDIYSNFLPIFLAFYSLTRRKSLDRGLIVIVCYCFVNFLINFLLDKEFFNGRVNYFLYASYTFFEFSFFGYFLFLIIKTKKFRRLLLITGLSFLAFLPIYDSTITARGIDSIPIGVETILILLFSFLYLYEQMNDTETLFIYSKYQFWIIIGFMIYLAGSFFIYIFTNQSKEALSYWYFTNIFSIIKNLFFSVAIFVYIKEKKAANSKFHPYLN